MSSITCSLAGQVSDIFQNNIGQSGNIVRDGVISDGKVGYSERYDKQGMLNQINSSNTLTPVEKQMATRAVDGLIGTVNFNQVMTLAHISLYLCN